MDGESSSDDLPDYSRQLYWRVATVRYSLDALRSLKRYGSVAARLRNAIETYAAGDGAHANNVQRLVGASASRLRLGDCRIVFEESETELIVTKVGPRGDVYD